jgi:uracil-DNA glycosylase
MTWEDIQGTIRTCRQCQKLEGSFFAPFRGRWPEILRPQPRSILFISEAPPQDGGFWTVQAQTDKQDDLREKLLTLLKLSSHGPDHGLVSFRNSGYFLLQSFPRPLKISIGNVKIDDLKKLLQHPVETHLKDQVTFLSPTAILALGRLASAALSILFPGSSFAQSFESGDFSGVQGRTFREQSQPFLSATYLPSGNGRFWRRFWEGQIPSFVNQARSLT